MAGVADQDDAVAGLGVAPGLDVHLRDERARRVDRVQLPRACVRVHRRRDAVGRQHDSLAGRNVLLALDEDRAPLLEIPDDVDVVDDLLAHVNRRAVQVEGLLDRFDGALDPGAITAGRGKKDTFDHELRIAVAAVHPIRGWTCPNPAP